MNKVLRAIGAALIAVARPVRTDGVRARSPWVLLLGLLTILSWQAGISKSSVHREETYRVTASTGVHDESRFFFFLYHLGIYPLLTTTPVRNESRAEAERILREHPRSLYMDKFVTFRSGDRGRVFLYYPDVWFGQRRPSAPSLRPMHVAVWVFGLCSIFTAAWWLRRALFGGLLVALFGSNPMQLSAVYFEENIFCWPIASLALVLALNAVLLPGKAPRRPWHPFALALSTGVLLALIRTVRSEAAVLMASAALLYVTLPIRWWRRGALVLTMLVTFSSVGALCTRYFISSSAHAATVVRRVGGVPYTGPIESYHEVWHPIWCGLGDFDTTYGYAWSDFTAYTYALPVLERRAGRRLNLDPTRAPQVISYDGQGYYPIFFFETPGYHDVIREKVLRDIRETPFWYAKILIKRTLRILEETTPVQFVVGSRKVMSLKSDWLGPFALLVLAHLLLTRRWGAAKLLLFSVPLSINPFLIYSGGGLTYYSCFHIVALAIAMAIAARFAAQWLTKLGHLLCPPSPITSAPIAAASGKVSTPSEA
ncbi:MAG: hypothetical protein Q8Q09_18355 [Deltaproteobacteria bacterium]|nr:hypothetical protein [Deltaproteobacteria bacterium]